MLWANCFEGPQKLRSQCPSCCSLSPFAVAIVQQPATSQHLHLFAKGSEVEEAHDVSSPEAGADAITVAGDKGDGEGGLQ